MFIKNQKEKGASASNQEKAKFIAYVNPIRLMMENDSVSKDQLTIVFNFLKSNEGEFWKSNILSTSKLREKFNQLIMKANEKKSNNSSGQSDQSGASDEFRRKTAERLGIDLDKYEI
ncbi:hypothetical protein [Cellulophaga sp. L1A9]|uniref:hypothetical protein n=1 Tax=Cellulophaga sp. L1A9 TaxID=2686362 RepID=UPI00131C6746|nr:hypothetical protein [Cellulophaga sp. L1A9]